MKKTKRKKFAYGTGSFGIGSNIYENPGLYQTPKTQSKLQNFGDWFLENGQMLGAGIGMAANRNNFAMGGVVPNVPVEVEGQEVGETPSGQMIDFKGPSHEQGGIDVKLPKGTEIFSKRIKVGGKTMAERKKEREKRVLSLEKLLEKNGNDKLLKDSLKRTIENNEKEDLKDQEIQSMISDVKNKISGQSIQPKQKFAGGTPPGGITPVNQQQLTMDGLNLFDWDAFIKGFKQTPPNSFGPQEDNHFAGIPYLDPNNNPGHVLASNKNAIAQNEANFISGPSASKGDQTSFFGPQNPDGSSGDPSQYFKSKSGGDPSTSQVKKDNLVGGAASDLSGTVRFTPGDITGLAGTIYSSFRPMQNTKENRAGDTPNINAYEDYGKEGLETIENAKTYISGQKDRALNQVENARAGLTQKNRNTARGVNSMRSLDLAANVNANAAEGDVFDNFSKQMMQMLSQQAGFENAQDSAVMGGEQARDMADRQDRDQYYSNLAQDISSKGQGIQTMGKMLNQNKRNNVSEAAINLTSENGYKWNGNTVVDKNGVNVDVSVLKADLAKMNEKLPEGEKITLKEYYNLIKNK